LPWSAPAWRSACGQDIPAPPNAHHRQQLRGIDAVWIAKIATLQPFDPSHTGDRESHPLAILDKANNITKHRLLPASLQDS
jgi:hypothetical protein